MKEWDRIVGATKDEWLRVGAVGVDDAEWVRVVWARNGSWLLISRRLLTVGYMRSAWWTLEGEAIDEGVINLLAEQCPPRCTPAVVLLLRVIEEGRQS